MNRNLRLNTDDIESTLNLLNHASSKPSSTSSNAIKNIHLRSRRSRVIQIPIISTMKVTCFRKRLNSVQPIIGAMVDQKIGTTPKNDAYVSMDESNFKPQKQVAKASNEFNITNIIIKVLKPKKRKVKLPPIDTSIE
jgi:hypothetical protein